MTLKWYQVYALNTLIFAATLNSKDREDIAIGKSLQMKIGEKLA